MKPSTPEARSSGLLRRPFPTSQASTRAGERSKPFGRIWLEGPALPHRLRPGRETIWGGGRLPRVASFKVLAGWVGRPSQARLFR
eukprot:5086192-Heterocapsa_arctica.AAC.1